MSQEGDEETSPDSAVDAVESRSLPIDRVVIAVLGIAVVGLALRLVDLGARPFHWDEARVGYWALRYVETGAFQYRPVAGGPLLYHLDRMIFSLVGVSDRLARLPVAVLGAALPLCALLFRDRLDDAETVAFAAVLAVQPLVLYYSRFLRGDVPLALFGLAAVGFAVRAWDRRSRRDAYAAAVALPLAASASGFVVGYVACWLAALFLIVDQRSVAADGGRSARAAVGTLRKRLEGTSTPAARAGLLATGVTAFLFAPRAGPGVPIGLYDPSTVHLAVYEGTVGAFRRFVGVRIVNRFPEGTHAILPYVADSGRLFLAVSLPVVLLGAAATLRERYTETRRPVVEGVGYWGLLAVVVFPTIAEVSAPWTLVHVIVPLSLPAAVGLVALLRWGADAAVVVRDAADPAPESPVDDVDADTEIDVGTEFDAGDRIDPGIDFDAGTVVAVVLVVLAVTAAVGGVIAGDVYGPSDRDNRLAQYGQPSDDLDPIRSAAANATDGDRSTAEVVYVGSAYHVPNHRSTRFPPVGDIWGNRLPLPWYVASADADATSVANATELDGLAETGSVPPIVVTDRGNRNVVAERLDPAYEATTYRLGLWNREVVVFVDRSRR
ncbi:flippase activity-associated protein Agl23 [Halobellus marinus]|uniref:flippase activity-associated protein Agl23 n=1 Tax=Halobellus TaxID=1073986 RepID=UPI0028A5B4B8|nr:flippase activity-associated protein Agl23 [Halobellus sp. DFY28]